MHRILIADDERVIRGGLETLLKGEGYEVVSAADGEAAVRQFVEHRPNLVLMDVMMPKLNGFKACERIKSIDSAVPVLFLTARDSEADEVRGLGLGGDDYIAKGVSESVLLARISRAINRCVRTATPAEEMLGIGSLTVDVKSMELRDGTDTRRLTPTELDLLLILASDPGRYFSKDELIESLRGRGFACEDGLVYAHMYRLRAKLGSESYRLQNGRVSGYRLLI